MRCRPRLAAVGITLEIEDEIVVIGRRERSVQARSCNTEQLALPAVLHHAVVALDEQTAVRGAHIFRACWLKNRVPR